MLKNRLKILEKKISDPDEKSENTYTSEEYLDIVMNGGTPDPNKQVYVPKNSKKLEDFI